MKKLNLTDKRNPDYFYSEAIKTLRTNIQLSGQSIKTILVTSCYPNEGKSDIVLSLAQELGSIGKKVLLLDADIRKTAYAGRLGVEEEVKGLSQLLSGQVGLQEIILQTFRIWISYSEVQVHRIRQDFSVRISLRYS